MLNAQCFLPRHSAASNSGRAADSIWKDLEVKVLSPHLSSFFGGTWLQDHHFRCGSLPLDRCSLETKQ